MGVLIIAYSYLGWYYIPRAYRHGGLWAAAMFLIGLLSVGPGVIYAVGYRVERSYTAN